MKRIQSYTIGWDIIKKEGYLTLTDENQQNHSYGQLSLEEMALLQSFLNQETLHLDSQQWLIAKWIKTHPKK